MEKTARIYNLGDRQQAKDQLAHWRSKTSAERIAAVEQLRRHEHGSLPRLRRVARVLELGQR